MPIGPDGNVAADGSPRPAGKSHSHSAYYSTIRSDERSGRRRRRSRRFVSPLATRQPVTQPRRQFPAPASTVAGAPDDHTVRRLDFELAVAGEELHRICICTAAPARDRQSVTSLARPPPLPRQSSLSVESIIMYVIALHLETAD